MFHSVQITDLYGSTLEASNLGVMVAENSDSLSPSEPVSSVSSESDDMMVMNSLKNNTFCLFPLLFDAATAVL